MHDKLHYSLLEGEQRSALPSLKCFVRICLNKLSCRLKTIEVDQTIDSRPLAVSFCLLDIYTIMSASRELVMFVSEKSEAYRRQLALMQLLLFFFFSHHTNV